MNRFAWDENVSTNTEAARAFYLELMGWTARSVPVESPMGEWPYWLLNHGTDEVAGMMPMMMEGQPSAWFSTIFVDDLDVTIATVKAKGGTVYNDPPVEIPEQGRFSWILDPQGACLVLGERLAGIVAPPIEPGRGRVVWHELMTTDVNGARAFYADLLGWQPVDSDMGSGPYTFFMQGEQMVAGAMPKPDHVTAPAWFVYLEVPNIDEAIAKVRALGGQADGVIHDNPEYGLISWASDPAGAKFAMLATHESDQG